MRFYSHGKVLLTGEYAVLDGAKAIALPTRQGQKMEVEYTPSGKIHWKSYTHKNELWVDCQFDFNINLIEHSIGVKQVIDRLKQILQVLNSLQPQFFQKGVTLINTLEFDTAWGLGSSSTLISNLSKWLDLNPYELLDKTFGGSGYDLAAAQANSAIIYQRKKWSPIVKNINFNPPFTDQLYFVYLNQKQNSREAIKRFRNSTQNKKSFTSKIDRLTASLLEVKDQIAFNQLLAEHEYELGERLEQQPIQKRLFNDYKGQIKSLGAWGGDFILASGDTKTPPYFIAKGYRTVIPFRDFIFY